MKTFFVAHGKWLAAGFLVFLWLVGNRQDIVSFFFPPEPSRQTSVPSSPQSAEPGSRNQPVESPTFGDPHPDGFIPAGEPDFGDYHALLIGNDQYRHLPRLKNARRDVETLSKVLKDRYGFQVTILLDATRDHIITALDRFRDSLHGRDNLLIYYAGHGRFDPDANQGYWLPVEAEENRRANWVSNADVTDNLKALGAKHVLLVSDSCYAGKLVRGEGLRGVRPAGEKPGKIEDFFHRMAQRKARTVMTSGGLEPVLDGGGQRGLSVFATAFIDALEQRTDAVFGTQALFGEIQKKVGYNAEQIPEYSYLHGTGHDGGDFLFVRARNAGGDDSVDN
uniref:Caspase domain-containing protein n=1 Tax=Candidatus Kentrum sp. FW TaxID=2126338 RepID=A0A450SX33_9GAMM|nr:MAG: Caspase domain-containing protein [Candidatus Kentron sp. FW]